MKNFTLILFCLFLLTSCASQVDISKEFSKNLVAATQKAEKTLNDLQDQLTQDLDHGDLKSAKIHNGVLDSRLKTVFAQIDKYEKQVIDQFQKDAAKVDKDKKDAGSVWDHMNPLWWIKRGIKDVGIGLGVLTAETLGAIGILQLLTMFSGAAPVMGVIATIAEMILKAIAKIFGWILSLFPTIGKELLQVLDSQINKKTNSTIVPTKTV